MASDKRDSDSPSMTALQRLLTEQRAQRGLSQADVADRSKDSQGRRRLNRQRVWQLENEPIKRSPATRTVEGLAAGLGVPMSTVKDAITESLGLLVIRDQNDPDLSIYIDEIESLDPARRQRYIRMARALLDEFKQ